MNITAEPTLSAPGAGLPTPELFVARILFRRTRSKGREILDGLFDDEHRQLSNLASACGDLGSQRVLIPRPRGLEDSSRYWSVWMVLDHLRIVNASVADTIRLLSEGRTPDQPVSTANVKPDPEVGVDVLDGFEKACEVFRSTVDAVKDLRTETQFAHPWFGLLNAADWHAMGAMHMRLHRKQVEAILKRL